MRGTCWPGLERAPGRFLRDLHREALARNWDVDSLLGHISHESRFKTDAKSPIGSASGLIQMIDSVARRFSGVSSELLLEMSHEEQLPGIVKYFDVGKPLSGADFLLLGVSRNSALLDAPGSRVIYAAGSKAAEGNPTLQDPSGAITVDSVRGRWMKWADAHSKECEPSRVASNGGFGGALAVAILLVGGLALAKRRVTR